MQQTTNRVHKLIEWILYLVAAITIFACATPFLLFGFLGINYSREVENTQSFFPIYPNATYISHEFSFLDVESGIHVDYYWTADQIENVADYFRTLELRPIVSPVQNVVSFSLTIEKIPERTHRFGRCILRCVDIDLVDFAASRQVSLLPAWIIERLPEYYEYFSQRSTPTPTNYHGGTLIIYSFQTEEM